MSTRGDVLVRGRERLRLPVKQVCGDHENTVPNRRTRTGNGLRAQGWQPWLRGEGGSPGLRGSGQNNAR